MNYPIPKPREKSRWLNLSQGSLPLALARYLPHKRLKVVLTQDAEQALRLQTAWRFFRPHDTAVFLPDWVMSPPNLVARLSFLPFCACAYGALRHW